MDDPVGRGFDNEPEFLLDWNRCESMLGLK